MRVMVAMVMVMSPMAAAAAARVVVMRIGIDKRRGQSAFERDRLLTRGITGFDGQRHHLGAEPDIVHLAEIVPAQAALAVENEQRRRALDLERRHGFGQFGAVRRVDRDGKFDFVFLEELGQRVRLLLVAILEHRMQPDDRDLVGVERGREPGRLGKPMLHRSGAEHLEGRQDDDFALERLQRQGPLSVEPARGGDLGRLFGVEHGGVLSAARRAARSSRRDDIGRFRPRAKRALPQRQISVESAHLPNLSAAELNEY